MAIELGVQLPQLRYFRLSTDVADVARGLEEQGFDSAWCFDRLLVPEDQSGEHGLYGVPGLPWNDFYRHVPDPIVTLSMAAAVTKRIKLGTSVLIAPLHHPVRLARSLATLDAATEGRFLMGLGTGWSPDEYDAAAERPFKERGAALDEFLDIAEAMWGPDPVSYKGDRHVIVRSAIGPKPAGRIPVLLGASTEKAFSRIARRADGWLPTGVPPSGVASTLARIRELAVEYGRAPEGIRSFYQILTDDLSPVDPGSRQPFQGSLGQLVDDIGELAGAGVEHVFLTLPLAVREKGALLDASAELIARVREAGL